MGAGYGISPGFVPAESRAEVEWGTEGQAESLAYTWLSSLKYKMIFGYRRMSVPRYPSRVTISITEYDSYSASLGGKIWSVNNPGICALRNSSLGHDSWLHDVQIVCWDICMALCVDKWVLVVWKVQAMVVVGISRCTATWGCHWEGSYIDQEQSFNGICTRGTGCDSRGEVSTPEVLAYQWLFDIHIWYERGNDRNQ